MATPHSLRLYDISNYIMNSKDATPDEAKTSDHRMQKMKEEYAKVGMRRSVHAVMLANSNGHPHLLLLQGSKSKYFRLPGDQLAPGETEEDGLHRILQEFFGSKDAKDVIDWPIIDTLASWWRPFFDANFYPYVPVHCTKPKEQSGVRLIQLPEKFQFLVPTNYKLVAVPLYDVYDNRDNYGHIIASLPPLLSRFSITNM